MAQSKDAAVQRLKEILAKDRAEVQRAQVTAHPQPKAS